MPADAWVFYGSSSIRFWRTLTADFQGTPVINRGFGGSTLADCLHEFDRLVTPLAPRGLVLYAGENDLDQGASPEVLQTLFINFISHTRARLGPVPMVVISVKPSPARLANIANIRRANALLGESIAQMEGIHFLNIFDLMLDADQTARREFFAADCLHLSRAGYRLWSAELKQLMNAKGMLS